MPISCVVLDSIFGHEGEDAADVVYINWLSMVRAGLLGLEFYTPESKSWRQVTRLALVLSASNSQDKTLKLPFMLSFRRKSTKRRGSVCRTSMSGVCCV